MIIGSQKGSRRSELQGNINITPFTDVILVLLIVFMISAPGMILSSFKIQLPGAPGQTGRGQFDMTVGLDQDGVIYVNGKETERADLQKQLSALPEPARKRILLNADSRAPYGSVVEIIDLMKKAGAEAVYAGTVPAGKRP
ncbi:MAG: biopolymer transporter ExbD [Leptonema illini]|jgi:biopolymer transport protein ExbD|uniref:Biopolymer transport protein ExbD/TolR n=2 Tax=Leptonema illini TaxID=183 RepID=H2CE22_9LEPT|nr:biopolymer transporter ExbD [Leptonema illini]EHQ06574.1 Biopolymer transport protein ExbD/TolR [Leptonema illini DSM 21528]KAB2934876.1 MAG: biopolymer transporter ExbD [Leptonema illini]PKL32721.1 MAG: biopolymer transporter ExbD [Spirochaetae bacterium HGW-Spirochaetae-10]